MQLIDMGPMPSKPRGDFAEELHDRAMRAANSDTDGFHPKRGVVPIAMGTQFDLAGDGEDLGRVGLYLKSGKLVLALAMTAEEAKLLRRRLKTAIRHLKQDAKNRDKAEKKAENFAAGLRSLLDSIHDPAEKATAEKTAEKPEAAEGE
jgi:hypothetical protein